MKNQIIDEFFKSRFSIEDKYVAVRYRTNNRLDYDTALLEQFITKKSKVLDLGCGTGVIEDKLASKVSFICGVDKYQEFLTRATVSNNIEYINSDICTYYDNRVYDTIVMFGVSIYLSEQECLKTFKNCKKMLVSNGVFILKNQFGVKEKVIIDKYSEELKSNYYAEYRQLDDMVALLNNTGFIVDIVDIYPAELNRWENTHEYALICKHKQ